MGAIVKPTVAICGTVGSDVDELVALVERETPLLAMRIVWPDDRAFDEARRQPLVGYVLVGGRDADLEGIAQGVLARLRGGAQLPVIAFGGSNAPRGATSWVPGRPTVAVLNQLLGRLVPVSGPAPASIETGSLGTTPQIPESEPPPRSWRRKSDMIIGVSREISTLLATLDRLARSSAPVLVTGESGTGKELVAHALHYTGARASAPFIAINCGAIPENLFEAELFGYQRGAFTGAATSHPGAFEAADAGTLFLDEIGELPLSMQVKLLRVLETSEVKRLGSNDARRLNVRVVAATHRNLEAEVRGGRFREDLFYRVSVCPVHVPPLRDRPEDIAPLVNHHLAQIGHRERRGTLSLTRDALERLLSYSWPGNVRELINVLERAVLLADASGIDATHVVLPDQASTPLIAAYRDAKERFERDYYGQLLRTASGNVTLAAKLAQKTRKEVYDALRRLGLAADVYRDSSGTIAAATPVKEDSDDTG